MGLRALILRNSSKALVTMKAHWHLRTKMTMHQIRSKAIKTPRCEGEHT
jgi:hypothetical protein